MAHGPPLASNGAVVSMPSCPSRRETSLIDEFSLVLQRELADRIASAHTGVQLLESEDSLVRRDEVVSLVRRVLDEALLTIDDLTSISSTLHWASGEHRPFSDVVQHVWRGVRPFARAHRVRLEMGDSPLPTTQVDACRAQRMLWNLIMNGIRFADHTQDDPKVELEIRLTERCVLIEVTANRVDAWREDGEGALAVPRGVGIRAGATSDGLATVADIVYELGGRLEVEGGGARRITTRAHIPIS